MLLAEAAVVLAVVEPLSVALSAGAMWVGGLLGHGGLAFNAGAVLGSAVHLTSIAQLGLGLGLGLWSAPPPRASPHW